MESDIARANIQRYRELLKGPCNEEQRRTIVQLLHEEEAKLLQANDALAQETSSDLPSEVKP
jgi:hypothetical protein